jgi:hypothetical protein
MKESTRKIDYELRISPNEVLRRIAETSDVRQIALFESGSKPFNYSVNGNEINIRKRRTYRNDFRSSLSLKVESTNYGSKLRGRFSMGVFPIIFLVGWMTIVGSLSLISIADIFKRIGSETLPAIPFPNLIPILMFFGGLVVFFLARFIAKREEREIFEWLANLFADSIIKH